MKMSAARWDKTRGRARDVLKVYSDGKALWDLGARLTKRYLEHTVKVRQEDPRYNVLSAWVLELLGPSRQRAAVFQTHVAHSDPDPDDGTPGGGARSVVSLLFDSAAESTVRIAGHRVRVKLEGGGPPSGASMEELLVANFGPRREALVISCLTAGARDAVVAEMTRVVQEADRLERRPSVYFMTPYANFRRMELPPRPLESVILRDGLLGKVQADLSGFLASETRYAELAVPWHRGYLLHGPPGTGKTSLARALASHFRMDLYVAALGDLSKDSSLHEVLGAIPPRSILLLEDVDVFSAVHDRDQEKGTVSLSGLLNALDGVTTPHGLVTVMTTNYRDRLDEALTRAGRIDLEVKLEPPDADQASRLFERFYGRSPGCELHADSVAQLAEVMKRHLGDAVAAELELRGPSPEKEAEWQGASA